MARGTRTQTLDAGETSPETKIKTRTNEMKASPNLNNKKPNNTKPTTVSEDKWNDRMNLKAKRRTLSQQEQLLKDLHRQNQAN